MIILSPPLGQFLTVGPEGEADRDELIKHAATMDVTTITVQRVRPEYDDDDVHELREFLDHNGLSVGEFTGFYKGTRPWGGLGGYDREDHRYTLELYERQLRHAKILGAHLVGFGTLVGRGTPKMWEEDTWQQVLDGIRELADLAEDAGMDIGAHPHVMTCMYSVERLKQMLDTVASPRLKILMDPVNLVHPHMAYRTTELVDEIFDGLGSDIVGLHAKDVAVSGGGKIVSHVGEAVPGEGTMDYHTMLRRLDALDHDVTVHAEHFPYPQTVQGQQYLRSVAREVGVELH